MRSISASSYGSVVLAVLIHTRVEFSMACGASMLSGTLTMTTTRPFCCGIGRTRTTGVIGG